MEDFGISDGEPSGSGTTVVVGSRALGGLWNLFGT
jgi:hypothetical protein